MYIVHTYILYMCMYGREIKINYLHLLVIIFRERRKVGKHREGKKTN